MFLEELQKRVFILDGAMGTELQKRGVSKRDCPDYLSIKEPELIVQIHREYVNAGADIIETNTFGANRIKLSSYGLQDMTREINIASARIAREVAGNKVLVAGSMGPLGKLIIPLGELDFEDVYEAFREQAMALEEGGVDFLLIETMIDVQEARIGVMAAKENTNLPVACSMTYTDEMRTVSGSDPFTATTILDAAGADIIGSNCGEGFQWYDEIISEIKRATDKPIIIYPNAGIPIMREGGSVFPATPEEFLGRAKRYISMGVSIMGGCCGTTPEHIRLLSESFKDRKKSPVKREFRRGFSLASRTQVVSAEGGFLVIGERINVSGRKKLLQEVSEGSMRTVRKDALAQVRRGAKVLDVNLGLPALRKPGLMRETIYLLQSIVNVPFSIDSDAYDVVDEGLKASAGKSLVNSVSGKEGALRELLPLVRRFGASFIALPIDESGIPDTAEGRVDVARKIIERALEEGISSDRIIVDGLVFTVASSQTQAVETLRAINRIKSEFGLPTVLGVSNVSYGLPQRGIINAVFLAMAIYSGLDAGIINPLDDRIFHTVIAADVLMGKDKNAERYISTVQGEKIQNDKPVIDELSIEEGLRRCILEGDKESIKQFVVKAVDEGRTAFDILNNILIPAMREVGDLYEKKVYFLPQLVMSAEAMQVAFEMLKDRLPKADTKKSKKVVIATVSGDLHDIGKNIVALVLKNYGYEVFDLGKDVDSVRIVQEAKEKKADVIALSALMTTTMLEMEKVVKLVKEDSVGAKVIVGGAAVTKDFAEEIGANGYGKDAIEAVNVLDGLLK